MQGWCGLARAAGYKKQKNTKQIKNSNTRKRRRARVKSILMSNESARVPRGTGLGCNARQCVARPARALRLCPRAIGSSPRSMAVDLCQLGRSGQR